MKGPVPDFIRKSILLFFWCCWLTLLIKKKKKGKKIHTKQNPSVASLRVKETVAEADALLRQTDTPSCSILPPFTAALIFPFDSVSCFISQPGPMRMGVYSSSFIIFFECETHLRLTLSVFFFFPLYVVTHTRKKDKNKPTKKRKKKKKKQDSPTSLLYIRL